MGFTIVFLYYFQHAKQRLSITLFVMFAALTQLRKTFICDETNHVKWYCLKFPSRKRKSFDIFSKERVTTVRHQHVFLKGWSLTIIASKQNVTRTWWEVFRQIEVQRSELITHGKMFCVKLSDGFLIKQCHFTLRYCYSIWGRRTIRNLVLLPSSASWQLERDLTDGWPWEATVSLLDKI